MSLLQRDTETTERAKRMRQTSRTKLFWSPEEEQLLRDRYADEDTASIAGDLGRPVERVYAKAYALGLAKSGEFMAACLRRCGEQRVERWRATRFQQGLEPWNQGMKGLQAGGRSKETQFKKGSKPHTWLPIGSHSRTDLAGGDRSGGAEDDPDHEDDAEERETEHEEDRPREPAMLRGDLHHDRLLGARRIRGRKRHLAHGRS